MKYLWQNISHLGISDESKNQMNRTIVLSNQINLMLFTSMLLAGTMVFIMNKSEDIPLKIGFWRIIILLFISLLNYFLAFHHMLRIFIINDYFYNSLKT